MRLAPLLFAAVFAAVSLVVWAGPRPLEAGNVSDAAIRNAVTAALGAENLPDAFWGVYVQNLQTGEVVVSRNADKNLMPASNMKLVTVATALDALGPDFRYVTRLYFDGTAGGEAGDSTLRGDLVLRGSGDPTFGSVLAGPDPLRAWAEQLRAMGVRRIEGRLIGDDDVMDERPYANGWDISYIATEDWAAPAGGLTFRDNLVTLSMAGTRPGEPAEVTTDPAGYVEVTGDLATRGRRGYNPLRIRRTVGTNQIQVEGSVSSRYEGAARIPIQDPTAFTLHAFAERLRDAGITVAAEVVDADNLEEPPSYAADPVLVHLSPPLLDILTTVNHRSNNLYAEQVFRTFSGNGGATGGERRVLAFLERAGIRTDGIAVRDGSGLSRKNLLTPETLGQLLAYVYRSPMRGAFVATLPQGGEEQTTLRYRLPGLPVRAKTGALEHVRALSGYAAGADGTPYVFVAIANNFTSRSSLISVAQNEIATAIAEGGR
ncbi:MAG: D-alanyl-D-alanine carboxypeptidase/D-alanyl-D-alanine-endopeptidase [Bacteroidota bacterium]